MGYLLIRFLFTFCHLKLLFKNFDIVSCYWLLGSLWMHVKSLRITSWSPVSCIMRHRTVGEHNCLGCHIIIIVIVNTYIRQSIVQLNMWIKTPDSCLDSASFLYYSVSVITARSLSVSSWAECSCWRPSSASIVNVRDSTMWLIVCGWSHELLHFAICAPVPLWRSIRRSIVTPLLR